ncbi:MAG: OmpH family outer membrane protein [Phycisphaerales bacterium]|nr:OmpH family outer membrane protein [Phycisphaerales bacterium]
MKKIFALVLFLSTAQFLFAQAIATVSSEKLTKEFVDIKKVDSLTALERNKYVPNFTELVGKYQAQFRIVDSLKKLPTVNFKFYQFNVDSLSNLQVYVQEYQQAVNNKLEQYRATEAKPYTEKIVKAIKEVANKKKIDFVFDVASLPALYAAPTTDITNEVVAELKKTK